MWKSISPIMFYGMLTKSKSNKIRRIIVPFISINVMHNFVRKKFALVSLLPNKSMLHYVAAAIRETMARHVKSDVTGTVLNSASLPPQALRSELNPVVMTVNKAFGLANEFSVPLAVSRGYLGLTSTATFTKSRAALIRTKSECPLDLPKLGSSSEMVMNKSDWSLPVLVEPVVWYRQSASTFAKFVCHGPKYKLLMKECQL